MQQQNSIPLDVSRDIAQLGELQGYYQIGTIPMRNALENSIQAMAQVITEKLKKQRDILERGVVPGALSPERLGQGE